MICSYDYSFVDFPSKYSLVIYFAGCNLRCEFCYNKEVVLANKFIDFEEIKKSYIEQCNIFNDKIGVVFSGGEPTVAKDFKQTYEWFDGSPKAIHTNGLVVPNWNCSFDSVILSLKSSHEGIGDLDKYSEKMNNTMKYYNYCGYKELRMVKIEKNMKDYEYVLDRLSLTNSYNLCFVEEVVR